jgi:organic hydroperoxide reductase OsmC/OhrA
MDSRASGLIAAIPKKTHSSMNIFASVISSNGKHQVQVKTGNTSQSLDIPRKPTGDGSAINGGELLMLALATCLLDQAEEDSRGKRTTNGHEADEQELVPTGAGV